MIRETPAGIRSAGKRWTPAALPDNADRTDIRGGNRTERGDFNRRREYGESAPGMITVNGANTPIRRRRYAANPRKEFFK